MLISDILDISARDCRDARIISTECSQFIQESAGLPVFRALPKTYDTFQRVKVRQHKRSCAVSDAFNAAFDNEFRNIAARGVFTRAAPPICCANTDLFYVFPINGYKYIFNKGVQNSNSNFKDVIETLSHNVRDAFDITTDLIRYTYTQHNLLEGMVAQSEIIFYNIPYFYAVRTSAVKQYSALINI